MDEEQKQRILIAVLALNFTVIAMMIGLSIFGVFGADPASTSAYVLRIVTSLVVGGIAGAIGYFAAPSLMR